MICLCKTGVCDSKSTAARPVDVIAKGRVRKCHMIYVKLCSAGTDHVATDKHIAHREKRVGCYVDGRGIDKLRVDNLNVSAYGNDAVQCAVCQYRGNTSTRNRNTV